MMRISLMDVWILSKRRRIFSRKIRKSRNKNMSAIFARIYFILMNKMEPVYLCLMLAVKSATENQIDVLFVRITICWIMKLVCVKLISKIQLNFVKSLLIVSVSNVEAYIMLIICYVYLYLIRIALNRKVF